MEEGNVLHRVVAKNVNFRGHNIYELDTKFMVVTDPLPSKCRFFRQLSVLGSNLDNRDWRSKNRLPKFQIKILEGKQLNLMGWCNALCGVRLMWQDRSSGCKERPTTNNSGEELVRSIALNQFLNCRSRHRVPRKEATPNLKRVFCLTTRLILVLPQ